MRILMLGYFLLTILKHLQPDVILLDIQIPIMDGIATLPEIKKLYPNIKVIMLTMHNDHSIITKLKELGQIPSSPRILTPS